MGEQWTRIRNAQGAKHAETVMPYSRLKADLAKVLKEEGYIEEYRMQEAGPHRNLRVTLRYTQHGPVVSGIQRASKPGNRVYAGASEIP